jgi:hypothetical protein
MLLCTAAAPGFLISQTPAAHPSVLQRIEEEASRRSAVMDHAFTLTDVHGPRLTGSPAFATAGAWVEQRLKNIGLDNVRREPVPWGTGWSYQDFGVRLVEPYRSALIGSPGPWSRSTDGEVTGEPIVTPAPTDFTRGSYEQYVGKYRGRLKGRFVFLDSLQPLEPETTAPVARIPDAELARMAQATPSAPVPGPAISDEQLAEIREWTTKMNQFFLDEGVAGLVRRSRGRDGMVVSFGPSWAKETPSGLPPTVFLAAEPYNQILRLIERGTAVSLALRLQTSFHRDASLAFTLTGEIPGQTRNQEVVLLGAHLDSWTGATGATDNAAGCAVLIEAMRALRSAGAQPARTIRLALWGGHEGASVAGSKVYVDEHFGAGAAAKASRETLSVYLNLDNGGGKVRGIYLSRRFAAARPMLEAWLKPIEHLGAMAVVPVGEPSGSDHVSFYAAGLPGFMLIQDPLDYRSRTHHSNLDTFDHLIKADLEQAAAVVASLAFQAAEAESILPR